MTDELDNHKGYDQLADETPVNNIDATEETSSPAKIEPDNDECHSDHEGQTHAEVKMNMMGSKKKKKFEVDDLMDDLNAESDNNVENVESRVSDINGSNQHDST